MSSRSPVGLWVWWRIIQRQKRRAVEDLEDAKCTSETREHLLFWLSCTSRLRLHDRSFSWHVFHEQHWPIVCPVAHYSKCGPQTSSTSSTWELAEMHNLRPMNQNLLYQALRSYSVSSGLRSIGLLVTGTLCSVCTGSGRKTFIVSVITHVYNSCHQKKIFPTLLKPVLSKCISCRN